MACCGRTQAVAGYLTPKEAQDALARLLGAERAKPAVARATVAGKTWGDAVADWLAYVEHDKQIAPSTLHRYQSIVRVQLLPAFGERTPLRRVTTERITSCRDQALAQERLSRASIRQSLIVVHGIFKRAKRRGWVSHNPAADVEPVSTSASGDFNVLDPAQADAVADAETAAV